MGTRRCQHGVAAQDSQSPRPTEPPTAEPCCPVELQDVVGAASQRKANNPRCTRAGWGRAQGASALCGAGSRLGLHAEMAPLQLLCQILTGPERNSGLEEQRRGPDTSVPCSPMEKFNPR